MRIYFTFTVIRSLKTGLDPNVKNWPRRLPLNGFLIKSYFIKLRPYIPFRFFTDLNNVFNQLYFKRAPLGHIYHISWRLLKIGHRRSDLVGRPLPGFFLLLIIVARFLSPSESRVYSLLNSPPSDQTQSASNGGDQKTHRLLLVFPLKSFIRGPVQDWTTPSPISCNSFSILLFI